MKTIIFLKAIYIMFGCLTFFCVIAFLVSWRGMFGLLAVLFGAVSLVAFIITVFKEERNNGTDIEEKQLIAGMLRVEEHNQQFRQPNPNGSFPVCKPVLGNGNNVGVPRCERCGKFILFSAPCSAVPADKRWGRDYEGQRAIADD